MRGELFDRPVLSRSRKLVVGQNGDSLLQQLREKFRAVAFAIKDDQTPPNPPGGIRFDTSTDVLPRGWTRVGTNASTIVVTGNAVPLSRLFPVLQNRLDRMLIDATTPGGDRVDAIQVVEFSSRISPAKYRLLFSPKQKTKPGVQQQI